MQVKFTPNLVCTCGILCFSPTACSEVHTNNEQLVRGAMIGVWAMCLWQQSFTGGEKKEEKILATNPADKWNHAPDQSLAREIAYCLLLLGSARLFCFGELCGWFSNITLSSQHICVFVLVYEATHFPVTIVCTHQPAAVRAFIFLFTDSWRLVIRRV